MADSWRDVAGSGYFGLGDGTGASAANGKSGFFGLGNSTGVQGDFGLGGEPGEDGYFGQGGLNRSLQAAAGYFGQGAR